MKFKYKKYAPGVLRPVIPIEIIYRDRTVPYEVLVDSGADYCFFHAQIGEILGIDIRSGVEKEVWGITGVGEPYYVHPIIISVGGWKHNIEAGFTFGLSKFAYGVVGQIGFFDIYIVKFDLLKEELDLKDRNKI